MSTTRVRTSFSHPIRIDWLDVGPAAGRIGMTFAPGKVGPSQDGFLWRRDLDVDLAAIVGAGASTLVCLMEDHELPRHQIADLVASARSRGLEVLRLPIVDGATPTDPEALEQLLASIEERVAAGAKVVIHCLGGLGRTGTIAGCLLVRGGLDPEDALAALRRVRKDGRCPENPAQCDVVRAARR